MNPSQDEMRKHATYVLNNPESTPSSLVLARYVLDRLGEPIWRLWDEAEARKCKRVVAKWMWRAADGMSVCGQDTDGVLEWHERWEWWQDHNGHQSRLTPSHYFPLPVPPSLCLTKADGG